MKPLKKNLYNYSRQRMNRLHIINFINPSWYTSIEFFGYFQSNKNFLGYDEKIKEVHQPNISCKNYARGLYTILIIDSNNNQYFRKVVLN